jgi:hypothetical protein
LRKKLSDAAGLYRNDKSDFVHLIVPQKMPFKGEEDRRRQFGLFESFATVNGNEEFN